MAADNKYELRRHFCKSLSLGTGWSLPLPDDMFTVPQWQLNDFQDLKTRLNDTKHKLDFFDLDKWHIHTTKMNPAGLVINHIRKHVCPDFLTQAWCKFYEIACATSLIPRDAIDKNSVFTVHLCEAPGAFVSSLNHFLAINHEHLQLKWLAMTLNPYHEANGHPDFISDDRLILNTLNNWEFGPDYTGDIFQPGYSEHLYQTVAEKFGGNACLVTADGSIDCSDDPGEQENFVMRLHNYETMVALNILQDGGSLVLKMFTMFECNTICRMYLLCCLFRTVVVRKPATSKPGNSEVYVVCQGYEGRSLALPFIRTFFSTDQHDKALFPLSQVHSDFRTQLRECSEYFSDLQIKVIENNIDALSDKEIHYREMKVLQQSLCEEFITAFSLRPIRHNQELMSSNYHYSKNRINFKQRGISYVEKVRLRQLDLKNEAEMIYQEVMTCDEWKKSHIRTIFWGNREHLSVRLSDVQFRLGKPVKMVKGSKFCNESLIHYRLRVLSKFPRVLNKIDMKSRILYYRCKFDRPDITVCDLTEICAEHSTDNVTQQFYCLKAIIATLYETTDDLIIVGYPLYTQMSVACFFAVASMFETYGLLKPDDQYGHAFVFFRYKKNDDWLKTLNKVNEYLLPEANKDLALVSWVPIKVLIEQKTYRDIITVNNLCILHEIEPILSSFLHHTS